MAADIFLKLGTVKGESKDQKHPGEIEILNWSWGVSQTGSMAFGTGGGTGKSSFSDMSFTHSFDTASPTLLQSCATGEHIPEATLTQRKAGKTQQEFLVVKLKDILVTSVHPAGQDGDTVLETFTLQPAKIELEYKPQNADGSLGAGVQFKYDLKQNAAV